MSAFRAVLLGFAAAPMLSWAAEIESSSAAKQSFLTELRLRRVVAESAIDWAPEQYTTLLRIREAEAMGALELLRSKLGTLRGLAVEHGSGAENKRFSLTLPGYRRYIFLRSQDARGYFETKGAEAKWVFELKSMRGERLFSNSGILTQEGIDVYNRVERNLPTFWRYPDGRLNGTVRPPKEVPPESKPLPPQAGSRPPARLNPAAAERRAEELVRSGYVEITDAELKFLIKSTKMSELQLTRESSLQILAAKSKIFYLLSPSDPLMALIARFRAG